MEYINFITLIEDVLARRNSYIKYIGNQFRKGNGQNIYIRFKYPSADSKIKEWSPLDNVLRTLNKCT